VNGRVKTIKVAGRLRTSGAVAANAAALLGLGIVNGPLYLVRPLPDSGAVESILTDYEPPTVPCHAVWPATKMLPARPQLFIEFLAARLLKERL
jgi:DNA-binding transcriptional LysR family regulator